MKKGLLLLLTLALAATAQSTVQILKTELPSLETLYKELHANPELSFHEQQTSDRIANELREAGFDVTTHVGGFGVVGVLRNGPGDTVLVRTDLDALPVVEQTGRDYASTVTTSADDGQEVGVMHACGHDMHMTVFIGTARELAGQRDSWSGNLVFIAQPAEEMGAGARAMLEDGLYSRFPAPDYALALHASPTVEAGKVGYFPGYALANVDSVDITIRGIGGHGAYPHTTKDPVVIAAQVIVALQTIVSREVDPLDSAVVTVGSLHAGTKRNIIPDEAKLQLTVRSYSDQTRQQVLDAIERIAVNTARAAGVPENLLPEVKVSDAEFTPATYNSPELLDRLLPAVRESIGAENVVEAEPVMGGEDFSRYGRTDEHVPINIFWLGTVDAQRLAQGPELSLHSPFYWPTIHPTIETGVKAMTASVLALLGK